MRHTAITKLVKSGVDLPTIQRIGGRKTLSMVLRYTHVHGQHIDRADIAMCLQCFDLAQFLTLEARTGIEPMYGDLQSPA